MLFKSDIRTGAAIFEHVCNTFPLKKIQGATCCDVMLPSLEDGEKNMEIDVGVNDAVADKGESKGFRD